MTRSLTRIIGRDKELGALLQLLEVGPLVTITGTGGVGKSCLAMEAAAVWAQRTQGAMHVTDLSEQTQGELVPAAVSAALGLPSLDELDKHPIGPALLVLDNCEHLRAAVASVATTVVDSCPDVRVVATGREALGAVVERLLLLEPLAILPGTSLEAALQSPAVELFLSRVRDQGIDLPLEEKDAEVLLSLCRRLDGLPLAIELAASRIRSMTAEDILGGLDDRLRMLARRKSQSPERHNALRTTIDWSYEMIEPTEVRVFERVGVFPGEFDKEAARFACADLDLDAHTLLDTLDSLVDRSLLVPRPLAGVMRYALLESLREYAAEKLAERGELLDTRERFVGYMVARCQDLLETAMRAWPAKMSASLTADFANLRGAIHWCLEADASPDRAYSLASALAVVAQEGHSAEIAELGKQILQRWPDRSHEFWSHVNAAVATGHLVGGKLDEARAAAMGGLEGEDQEAGRMGAIACLRVLAIADLYSGELDSSCRRVDEALEIAAEQFLPQRCELLSQKARIVGLGKSPSEGIPITEENRALAERLDSPHMLCLNDLVAGWLHLFTLPALARSYLERSLEVARQAHQLSVVSNSVVGLAVITAFDGNRARASELFGEALDYLEQNRDLPQILGAVRWIALWLAQWGRRGGATRLFAAVEAHPGAPAITPPERAFFGAVQSSLQEEIDDLDVARAEAAGWDVRNTLRFARRELRALLHTAETEANGASPSRDRAQREPSPQDAGVFRHEGELWTLSYEGKTVHVRHLKGLSDIAFLLARPEHEVHCLDLAGRPAEQSAAPVLDARARREYEQRIQGLQEELAEAEAHNDFGRAEKAGAELDALTEQLAAAFGLGGRERALGSSAERARSTVGWRIRSALKRIENAHPRLGKHLRTSVQTGTYLTYSPPSPLEWTL